MHIRALHQDFLQKKIPARGWDPLANRPYLLLGLEDFDPLQEVPVPRLMRLTWITFWPLEEPVALALLSFAPNDPVPPAEGELGALPARDEPEALPLISAELPVELLAELSDTLPVTSMDSPRWEARRDVSAPAGI